VHSELVDITDIVVTPFATTCLTDAWTIDIPLAAPGLVLEPGRKYWLALQLEMEFQFGFATILASQHSNGLHARQHVLLLGTTDWTEIIGNIDGCPPGSPPFGTHLDVAFVLDGKKDFVPGDLDEDGVVGILDFLALLAAWGPCDVGGGCLGDLDGDGLVGIVDLLILLGNWG
jgi:hypothetical protein